MNNLISKAVAAANLLLVVLLVACGNANNCPSGQISNGNTCVANSAAYGYNQYGVQTGMNGGGCQIGQLYNPQYGCLQTNINGCSGNTGWSTQISQCVSGSPVTTQYGNQYNNGNYYNNGYNNYYNNGFYNNSGLYPNTNSQCGPGFVFTNMYGCLQQGGCGFGMGMGPFGCTY